jgi:hypothetical protein
MAINFFQKSPAVGGLAPRVLLCLAVAAAAQLVALQRRSAAEESIHFVAPSQADAEQAPAEEATPSTVSIAEAPDVETPALDEESTSAGEMIDLAALASFAQAAVEEIQGAPVEDASRPFRPITQITANAALPEGLLPGQAGSEQAGAEPSPIPEFGDARLWHGWAMTDYQWSATMLCHRPLYFEEVNLERYGYTVSPIIQPAVSAAHFFLVIPALPYKIVAQPPRECVYTLGYYRPGSPAPRRWHHVNWDPTAATVEGLLVTGLVFAIP